MTNHDHDEPADIPDWLASHQGNGGRVRLGLAWVGAMTDTDCRAHRVGIHARVPTRCRHGGRGKA